MSVLSVLSNVGSNDEQVMDGNQVMSMRYKKEKGTLESEKKTELDKYLNDDCKEEIMMHLKFCNFARINKRDTLLLPKWLRMCLLCQFLL